MQVLFYRESGYIIQYNHLMFSPDSWEFAVSGHGRNLLYAKSVEYTRKLHELLQSKYGIFAGAQRLAVLMNLLGMVNRVPYFLYEAMFRIGFFYEQKSTKEIFPKVYNSIMDNQANRH
jgi:hypothetical protein